MSLLQRTRLFFEGFPKKEELSHFWCKFKPKNSAHLIKENSNSQFENEDTLCTGERMYQSNSYWVVNSGATQHMTHDRDSLFNFVKFNQPSTIIPAYGKGTYRMTTDVERKCQNIALYDALYLSRPSSKDNLMKLSNHNMVIGMDKIHSEDGKAICKGCIKGKATSTTLSKHFIHFYN